MLVLKRKQTEIRYLYAVPGEWHSSAPIASYRAQNHIPSMCQIDDKLSLAVLREDARMWNWTCSRWLTKTTLEETHVTMTVASLSSGSY